jgi:hypothetical protein
MYLGYLLLLAVAGKTFINEIGDKFKTLSLSTYHFELLMNPLGFSRLH